MKKEFVSKQTAAQQTNLTVTNIYAVRICKKVCFNRIKRLGYKINFSENPTVYLRPLSEVYSVI